MVERHEPRLKKHNDCPDCQCHEKLGKVCSSCNVSFPVSNYRVKTDGYLQSNCYACELEYQKVAQKRLQAKRKAERQELIELRKKMLDFQDLTTILGITTNQGEGT